MLKSDAKVAATIIFAATINSAPTVMLSVESISGQKVRYGMSAHYVMTMRRKPQTFDIKNSFEPDLNQRPMDNCLTLLQSTALPTELSKGDIQYLHQLGSV